MATFDTFAALVADVLDRAGESPTDTGGDFYAAAQRQTVRGGRELALRHPFLALRADPPPAFVTTPPYTTGTVLLTQGAAGITFAPAPTPSLATRKLVAVGWPEVYRIAAHTAGATGATLDVAWQGPSATVAFTVYQDEVTIGGSDSLRHILGIYASGTGQEITLVPETTLNREYPPPRSGAEIPTCAARIGMTKLRLSQYPTVGHRFEVASTLYPPDVDSGTIWVPLLFRHVIADGALYFVHSLKNDNRADAAGILFGKGLDAFMIEDERLRLALGGPARSSGGPYQ